MNKIIFQLGLLGFCVSVVFFGINNLSLMDMISSAFIVFVGVVAAGATMIAISSLFVDRNPQVISREMAKQHSNSTDENA